MGYLPYQLVQNFLHRRYQKLKRWCNCMYLFSWMLKGLGTCMKNKWVAIDKATKVPAMINRGIFCLAEQWIVSSGFPCQAMRIHFRFFLEEKRRTTWISPNLILHLLSWCFLKHIFIKGIHYFHARYALLRWTVWMMQCKRNWCP